MQNTKLLLPKKKKKKKKPLTYIKTTYSYPIFKCLILIYICYIFEFKYFNYSYQKIKYKITSSKIVEYVKRVILSYVQKEDKKSLV